jgi:OTU domain-containing protein 6
LYAAIADQLALLGILSPAETTYTTTRFAASTYIYNNVDDFLPFLPSVNGEDGIGATDAGLMTPKQFETYCAAVRDTGVWGGEPEILALCRAFNVPIHVVQGGAPAIVVHNPQGEPTEANYGDKKVVRISYHRRMYGLGEVRRLVNFDPGGLLFDLQHYNSLRPKKSLIKSMLG